MRAHHIQVVREINPTQVSEQRTLPLSLQQIEEIKSKPTEQEKAQLRTLYGIKETYNPLLTIPADLYR